jgi:hypothetical protein
MFALKASFDALLGEQVLPPVDPSADADADADADVHTDVDAEDADTDEHEPESPVRTEAVLDVLEDDIHEVAAIDAWCETRT